jgi:hypothetical protein
MCIDMHHHEWVGLSMKVIASQIKEWSQPVIQQLFFSLQMI